MNEYNVKYHRVMGSVMLHSLSGKLIKYVVKCEHFMRHDQNWFLVIRFIYLFIYFVIANWDKTGLRNHVVSLCICHLSPLSKWKPLFDWCMVWQGTRTNTIKRHVPWRLYLHCQVLSTTPHSIVITIGRTFVFSTKLTKM